MKLTSVFICLFALMQGTLTSKAQNQSFKSIAIGKQVWMTENLDVDTFRNGDRILFAKTYKEWGEAEKNKIPAWCYANNSASKGKKYGKLYNGYAVMDPRGLAPQGWHIPNEEEWSVLIDFLGGKATPDVGLKMKNNGGWKRSWNGTNESGFSALPGGHSYSGGYQGQFNMVGTGADWWSSSKSMDDKLVHYFLFDWNHNYVISGDGSIGCGKSIRCIKD